jgi:alkylation response protein AidB-like acyl-CoA dehydrogenase
MNMVDKSLTPEQQRLQQLAREFTARHIIPVAAEYDRTGEFPAYIFAEAKKVNLHCNAVPAEYGGPGYDALSQELIVEEWAYGCAAFATTLNGNGLSSYPLLIAGTEDQKRLFFGRLVAGGIGGFSLTEREPARTRVPSPPPPRRTATNGCSTGPMLRYELRLCRHHDRVRLDQSGNGRQGAQRLPGGKERPGLTVGNVEHKMGIRSSNTVELILKNGVFPRPTFSAKKARA